MYQIDAYKCVYNISYVFYARQTFHELQHLSRKMMNPEKRDDNNVLPIEINLVHFDKPKVIDRKSKQTSTKQVKQ